MWFTINIDFSSIKKNHIADAKVQLDKFADEVVDEVKKNTPEDTLALLRAIRKTEQVEYAGKIYQSVKDMEWLKYTPYVEYWVGWRNFRYNKPKGNIFYVGVGAAMFRKAYAAKKNAFIKK